MASYQSGATRTSPDGKFDYEGFLSPLVLERYAEYMHKHRSTPDGGFRDSDNWQLGIPLDSYMKSGWRHFMDWFKFHRGIKLPYDIEEVLCAVIFNAMGYLHETLKKRKSPLIPVNVKPGFPMKHTTEGVWLKSSTK